MGNVLLSDKNTFSFIAPENGALRHSPKDCGEARLKFLIELFSKSSRCPEAEPLVALRRVRNTWVELVQLLSFKRIFGSLKPFCKWKGFQEPIVNTSCPQKLSSGWFLMAETRFGLYKSITHVTKQTTACFHRQSTNVLQHLFCFLPLSF